MENIIGKKVKFEYEGGNITLKGKVIGKFDENSMVIKTKSRCYVIKNEAIKLKSIDK